MIEQKLYLFKRKIEQNVYKGFPDKMIIFLIQRS